MKTKDYNLFLKSDYWGKVRKLVLERDKYKCQICITKFAPYNYDKKDLEIHHRTYKNHKNELNNLNDLITLCKYCHEYLHAPDDWDEMIKQEIARLMENPNS
jgi:5-methylcytosine-specific restriction endonuclease McrA